MNNNKQKLELNWIGKNEQINLEPRILIEDSTKSYGDKNTENILIHGDNLLALKALEQDFTSKIKCIYIDPPFNTENANLPYDDGLEHSRWLSLMEKRLKILYKLLRKDGVMVAHIDDIEQGYLKVIMDEIFDRKYFVNNIVVQDSHPSGLKLSHKDKKIIKTKSYMLVYKKSDEMRINPIYKSRDDWDTHFNTFIDINDAGLPRRSLKDVLIERGIITPGQRITKDALRDKGFREMCFNNRNNIYQSTKEIPNDAKVESLKMKDSVYKYTSNDGEINFALNGRRLSPLSKSIHNVGVDGYYEEDFAKLLCDFWDDVDFNNSQNEGGVQFPASKKPEFLIARLLTMFTSKGDIVLDSFAGSGTTGAVAHKMNRNWIMVELNDHCFTHICPRLKVVCDGTDQSGISSLVNWKGGGGFKYYYLAPSLLKQDKYSNWVIDENYNADMLAAAMAKHEGFKYFPNEEIYWKQGQSTEKDYIFTTTQFLTVESLDKINEQMKSDESLLICCKSFSKACDNRYPNITIKKIPKMLLGRCEFGRDDYSLNIISMPTDPDTPDFVPTGIGEKDDKKKSKTKSNQPSLFYNSK